MVCHQWLLGSHTHPPPLHAAAMTPLTILADRRVRRYVVRRNVVRRYVVRPVVAPPFFSETKKNFRDLPFFRKSFRLNSDPDISKRGGGEGERSKPSKDKEIFGFLYLEGAMAQNLLRQLFTNVRNK
jgi:hypothetical protein